jgi:uncharacterized hydrophobic protein (TIGR00341 family)
MQFKGLWDVSSGSQYRAVGELIDGAQPTATYYTLLILSSLIITGGILLGPSNIAIVIGGMLVTPLLTPVLVVALGITTGEPKVTGNALKLVGKSFLFVLIGALILGTVFGEPEGFYFVENTMRVTILYLIVAITSGIAATYAWVRKEAFSALPGVAIAVSLVPPVSFMGLALGSGDIDVARTFFIIMLTNVIGIVAGSMVVFSQFGFYRAKRAIERKVEKVEKEKELEQSEEEN